MMLYPAMPDLLKYVGNSRYRLVNVVARRARAIEIDNIEKGEHSDEKSVSTAIKDIADGKVLISFE